MAKKHSKPPIASQITGSITVAIIVLGSNRIASAQATAAAIQQANRTTALIDILSADTTDETRATVEKLSIIQSPFIASATTLRKATDDFRKAVHINVVVNWADLKTIGITQDTPVTLTLKNVSAHQILRSILDVAGGVRTERNPENSRPQGGTEEQGLDYQVSEGIIEIHTRAWLDRQQIPQAYEILGLTLKGFYIGPDATTANERETRLAELSRQMATPLLWTNDAAADGAPGAAVAAKTGGNVCKLLNHQLAVVAPLRSHHELTILFDALRHPIRLPVTKAETAENLRRGAAVPWPPRLRPTDAYLLTIKQLAEPTNFPEGAATNSTLDKTLVLISQQAGINLVMDWKNLANAGLTPNTATPDSLPAAASPLEKYLLDLFRLAAAKESAAKISLSVEGVLTLSTLENRDEFIAAYDARDLIRRWILPAHNPNSPAHPPEKLTERQAMNEILTGLAKAGFATGNNANPPASPSRVLEYEGILVMRGTLKEQSAIAQHLAALAR